MEFIPPVEVIIFDINRSKSLLTIFYVDKLNSMIKSSSDNYSKSSVECLGIGLCLYIAITFHNNLTKAKIANELITSVHSLNTIYSNKLCVISWPALLVKPWVLQTFDARFPVLINVVKPIRIS